MLDIHPSCKARLIERLENIINNGQIDREEHFLYNDEFVDIVNMDTSLPDTRDLKIILENYINERPLFYFCYHTIDDIVREQKAYNKDRATYPLTEVPFFQNAREAAERIINDFVSLPKEYAAIIRFRKELSVSLASVCPRALRNYGEYFRSEDVKLSVPTPKLRATFPDSHSREIGFSFHDSFKWQDESVYLVMNLKGFIPKIGLRTNPVEDCVSALKAFVGLALACHIVKTGEALISDELYADIYVFSQNGGDWALQHVFLLDENISAFHQNLQIGQIAELDIEEGKKRGIFRRQFRLIEAAFRAREGARKIRLSAEWLYDSYVNEEKFSSFIHATTALEILLGGSKEESAKVWLTELLANRLAYLIAKRPSDRENVMQLFRDIYDVRSNIVHSGKTRLNSGEREMLSSLKEMVGKALVAELELLIKEDELT